MPPAKLSRLIRRVACLFAAVALKHRIQPPAGDSEQARGSRLIAPRAFDRGEDQIALEEVDTEARYEKVGGSGGAGRVSGRVDVLGGDGFIPRENERALERILQLSHVPGPMALP